MQGCWKAWWGKGEWQKKLENVVNLDLNVEHPKIVLEVGAYISSFFF